MLLFINKLLPIRLVFVSFLAFTLFSVKIAFCANSQASIDYKKAQKSYHNLLQSKKDMQRRDQWVSVIQKFNTVYKTYASSSEAYKAIFTVGDLYEKLYVISRRDKDLDGALINYQKTIKEFKPGRLTDDALYRRGNIYFSRKEYKAALDSFEAILKILPKGDVSQKAKLKIKNIRPFVKKGYASQLESTILLKDSTRFKESLNKVVGKEKTIEKVDYITGPDSVRVVTHTSSPVTFSQGRLSNPERVYINFDNTRLSNNLSRDIKIGSRFLQGLRLSQFNEKSSRLVFDLNRVKNLKVGVWQKYSKLIVELSDENIMENKVASKPLSPDNYRILENLKKIKDKKTIVKSVVKITKKRAVTKRKIKSPLIVVDAGHGGKDLGAKGHGGLLEKDVNLSIALRLKDILKSRYKYQVILTRKDDTFIPLPGRGKIANDNDAYVFVSVHANAAPRRSAHGIETYYLGAGHSEQAKETAIRENGGLVKSVKDGQTQEILASMISTTKINKSSRLASNIQNQLYQSMRKKYPRTKNLGVKEGPFFVLHDTNMASALVEVGFLTNRKEERNLNKSSYLDKLASSIAEGIAKFVREYDPMI